jgi:ElaB/YqjD/DUF883 family membrane-anchored ribosome-binding protein
MSMAQLLRYTANVAAVAGLVKLVAGDLAAEVRRDVGTLPARTRSIVRSSPYGVAGAATVLGVIAGMMLATRQHPTSRPLS